MTLFENSLFCTDPTGAKIKIRPDICIPEIDTIADIKSAQDASPQAFARDIEKYNHHLSAAMYAYAYEQATGRKLQSFIFIVVEKAAPYAVAVYELDQESMQAGYRLYREAIDLYNECTRTGHWPGYSDQVESISLRPWALNKGSREE
jgi:exodeoxyribonuclease VIII